MNTSLLGDKPDCYRIVDEDKWRYKSPDESFEEYYAFLDTVTILFIKRKSNESETDFIHRAMKQWADWRKVGSTWA